MPVIARYAAITLPPMFLLIAAGTVWGGFAIMALIWLTLVALGADQLLAPPTPVAPEEETKPWADTLSVILAIGHILILISTTSALASGGLAFWQGGALFLATASFFGQVSHPNAHELIHRHSAALRALGAATYTSVGFGHHVSAHRLVHHRHVGTEADPNTPHPGESFWEYLPRAWRGSFEAGIISEVERLERRGRGPNHITNPYWVWIGGAVLSLVLIMVLAGPFGGVVLVGLGALTGAQILLSDYVQHYGLQRLILPNGRVEPVAAHHSWNAPKGFSSYLMMNAPAHSEHHLHPDRSYERLNPAADVPTLPLSLPLMAAIATVPSAWRRLMDRRALKVMEAAEAAHIAAATLAASAAPITPRRPDELRREPSPDAHVPGAPHKPPPPDDATSEVAPKTAPQGTAPVGPIADDPIADDPETAELLKKIRAATQ